jgi:hypothetical protein
MGDIDLLREIRLDNGIADFQRDRPRVRRVYTAKIEGRKSDVTVAVYQGEGAQEVHFILFSLYSLINLYRNGERTWNATRGFGRGKTLFLSNKFTFLAIRIWFNCAVSQVRR